MKGLRIIELLIGVEKEMEEILHTYEQQNKYTEALQGYRVIEEKLLNLLDGCKSDEETIYAYKILAQCYLRLGNMCRSLGKPAEAYQYSEKEAEFARLSGDSVSLAQSIFSKGISHISNNQVQEGLSLLDRALGMFEKGDTFDHIQGIGWYWIIKADIANKGIISVPSEKIVEFADQALEKLLPINNWPGISRAYLARSMAYGNLGKADLAQEDLEKSEECKAFIN